MSVRHFSKFKVISFIVIVAAILTAVIYIKNQKIQLPEKATHSAESFHIETIHSTVDFNKNGIDDYTDIFNGAQKDAKNKPKYDGSYIVGGYPPDEVGACTDVIWRAFKEAGYSLKDMVDEDIRNHPDQYPAVNKKPDPNIDFRRVPNLNVYFERHAESLTLDLTQLEQWQPGDIVVFGSKHIGILSAQRDEKGVPLLIHNAGQPNREDDSLPERQSTIRGHYRFDASKLDSSECIPFQK